MHTNEKVYNFAIFRGLADLIRNICYGDISKEQAKSGQDEMDSMLTDLKIYKPQNRNKIKNKNETPDNAQKVFMEEK